MEALVPVLWAVVGLIAVSVIAGIGWMIYVAKKMRDF